MERSKKITKESRECLGAVDRSKEVRVIDSAVTTLIMGQAGSQQRETRHSCKRRRKRSKK